MRAAIRVAIATAAAGLGIAGLTGQPAAAEPPWQQGFGMACRGIEVDRCAWLDWDPQGRRVRAQGNTLDNPGGGNFSVALSDVQVQLLTGSGWVTLTNRGDYDGWQPVWDAATSPVVGNACGTFRAVTYHRWTGASSGGEWVASGSVRVC